MPPIGTTAPASPAKPPLDPDDSPEAEVFVWAVVLVSPVSNCDAVISVTSFQALV